MWIPEVFESKSQQMDFTSSGQGKVDVTEVYADSEKLANAVELMDFDGDPIQFLVCDHCGYTQCASGNWLSIRKLGNYVMLIPSFKSMDEGEWEFSEYSPPYFTRVKGSIFVSEFQYAQLKKEITVLPSSDSIEYISSYELSRVIQWEAPYRVLGEYPNPIKFDDRLLSTTSHVSDEEAIGELNQILDTFCENSKEIELDSSNNEIERISFFLDGSDFIEWVPLAKNENGFGLSLTSDLSVFDVKKG